MINRNSKIYIAGHNGLVGSAILRKLKSKGYKNLIFKNRSKLNLLDQKKVFDFLKNNKPDFIFIAAAKVGAGKIDKTPRSQNRNPTGRQLKASSSPHAPMGRQSSLRVLDRSNASWNRARHPDRHLLEPYLDASVE